MWAFFVWRFEAGMARLRAVEYIDSARTLAKLRLNKPTSCFVSVRLSAPRRGAAISNGPARQLASFVTTVAVGEV
jgi:hypothetical protein